MSHCFGAICETHKIVMIPDEGCPERGCGRSHGYTHIQCGPGCPEWSGSSAELAQ